MKSNNSRIDHYFNKAREQESIVSKDEINQLVRDQVRPKAESAWKSESYQFNNFYRMSWLSTAAAILLLLIAQSPYQQFYFSESGYSGWVASANSMNSEHWPSVMEVEITRYTDGAKRRLKESLDAVSANHAESEVQYLNAQNPKTERIQDWLIPVLIVSQEKLLELGLIINEEEIFYETNVMHQGFIRFKIPDESGGALMVSDYHKKGIPVRDYYPLFMTDMSGKQGPRYGFDTEPKNKMSQEYFNEIVNDLVPIAIPSVKNQGEHAAILWFNATDALYGLLTSEVVAPNTPRERVNPQANLENRETEKLRVFPNPFDDEINISFSLPSKNVVRIHLMSIQGSIVDELMGAEMLEAGKHMRKFPTGHLASGIYLLRVSTPSKSHTIRIIKE